MIALELMILAISFVLVYFLSRRFLRPLLKENDIIGFICGISILTIFFMTRDMLFSSYTNSLFHAIVYGLVYGLAFGLGSRSKSA